LDKDDEDGNEVLGNGADGTSPTLPAFGQDYDASLLLAASITQVFPCIACKNINNTTTWIPIFL
jgi:hypothetical protein